MQPPSRGHWVLIQPWEYGSLVGDQLVLSRMARR